MARPRVTAKPTKTTKGGQPVRGTMVRVDHDRVERIGVVLARLNADRPGPKWTLASWVRDAVDEALRRAEPQRARG